MNDLLKEETIQETQKRRFNEALKEIFSEDFSLSKVEFGEEETLVKAKVNTNETLDKVQLDALSYLAESWFMTFQISRSGAGIKIEIKLNGE